MKKKELEMLSRQQYQLLLNNEVSYLVINKSGLCIGSDLFLPNKIAVIPGSFNPLHDAHKFLFTNAWVSFDDDSIFFEISISKRDKDPLNFEKLNEILAQFKNYANVIITNKPFFYLKLSTLLKRTDEVHFYIGADTLDRLIQDETKERVECFRCVFHVFTRNSIEIPKLINVTKRIMSKDLQEISSTQLRNKQ